MLLNDIGKSPDTTFRRINQYLETNYGFKISENISDKDLVFITEQIEEEIADLKVKGDDARSSSEVSKRLLVLEGIRSLKEYGMIQKQFQSSQLKPLIDGMVSAVVDHFEGAGVSMSDFEKAIEHTMREYRKSDKDFPNDLIEEKVRAGAMSALIALSQLNADSPHVESQISVMEETDGEAAQEDSEATVGIEEEEEQTPMIRDKSGRMVPDPFAAQADARSKGIAMKEHANLVKNLRRLLETEVSQAEVMMAAKGFSGELQEMVEKIGRLQNEDLPPVTDQMRETYGMESASAFQTQIYGALQSVMDALYTAKGQVDDAVGNMAATGQVGAATDMDKDVGMDDMGDDIGMDGDVEMGDDADLDNIGAELGEPEDDFGSEEALGRSKKMESVLQHKVMEMKKLIAKAKALREAQNTTEDEQLDEYFEYGEDKKSKEASGQRSTDVLSRRGGGMKHAVAKDPKGYKHMRNGQQPGATADQKKYGDMYPLGGPKGRIPENTKK